LVFGAVAPVYAEPVFRDVVVRPPVATQAPTPTKFANVSHLIYLNNCLPNGCTVQPGSDDSLTQHSSIPQQPATLAAWAWGQSNWDSLVQCVKDMYGPFDIQITDQDPGPSMPHFELIVGGNSSDVGVQGAGGVAPFIPCQGELQNNVISYVFAAETSNLDYLCWAAAQETSHVFGLDHEMNALDPMTYLNPPTKKQGFQNADANCGEFQARQCWCGGNTQNSYQYLMDTIGPSNLAPATLTITSPADGAWVEPGFVVSADLMSQLSARTGQLTIDGNATQTIMQPPIVFNAPASLTGGDHTITVTITDAASRTVTASVNVHVVASCAGGASCDKGFDCLGGFCLPGADIAGGLGATCTDNSQCITGSCASDGTHELCTGNCDPGNECPQGFTCTTTGNGGVCWPAAKGSGCGAGAPGSSFVLIFAVAAFTARASRRRSRAHRRTATNS
jgi:hypothetical protein